MTFELRRSAEHVRRPWRNGGGMTAEVAAWPPDADAASAFDWRVSFADVDGSGDFSLFPGVDRVITLLDGPAMTLRFPRVTEVLELFQPFAFDGGLSVACTVAGPTRDLNVMTRRGRVRADVEILELTGAGAVHDLDAGEPLLLIGLTGSIDAAAGQEAAPLLPGDVLVTDRPLTAAGSGRCAVVRIAPVDRLESQTRPG